MEALNKLIEKAKELDLVKGVWVGRKNQQVEVSYLFFRWWYVDFLSTEWEGDPRS